MEEWPIICTEIWVMRYRYIPSMGHNLIGFESGRRWCVFCGKYFTANEQHKKQTTKQVKSNDYYQLRR